ncbi:hypothetical protein LSH36_537g02076 [Paralvinella palmiformis]|uniref:Uncharacterized protein n=1 Tax=Paralvinella palmiformis TaxID=53620 RepID=A0AAD9J769_9ANNE|nr:hypothetical protein LSH36_537g02076 [Paralvinella palmiformis]
MTILVSGIVLSIGIQIVLCTGECPYERLFMFTGYSEYWVLDKTHTNCSVTDETCEKEIGEPSRNCSGLAVCSLYTCSSISHDMISCNGTKSANYMSINYTCEKVLNKQESGVNVIDSANYVTSGKVTEDTFDLETRCVGDPSLETSVVDNLNYASFGQREDIDQIDLPTSKADLNTDTELVDNDDYVGFGEK